MERWHIARGEEVLAEDDELPTERIGIELSACMHAYIHTCLGRWDWDWVDRLILNDTSIPWLSAPSFFPHFLTRETMMDSSSIQSWGFASFSCTYFFAMHC